MIYPQLQFLVFCDSVGKGPKERKTLYGLIDRLELQTFPTIIPSCTVLGRFASGDGHFEAQFAIRGPSDQTIFESAGACEFTLDDPLDSADVVLCIDNLNLPEPGTYWIEAWLNGEKLPTSTSFFADPTGE